MDCRRQTVSMVKIEHNSIESRLVTCELGGIMLRQSAAFVACADLLSHEWFRRSHKNHSPPWEPAVEVEHNDGSDESLACSGGQAAKRVFEQGCAHNLQLVPSDFHVLRIDPVHACLRIERLHR
eukprot:SAG31_NODE_2960_length_4850_cov_5.261840_2_plen_124_part_00